MFKELSFGFYLLSKFILNLTISKQWLFILNVTHESMCCFNISTIDPAMFAHCSLRLALLYEAIATVSTKKSSILKGKIR